MMMISVKMQHLPSLNTTRLLNASELRCRRAAVSPFGHVLVSGSAEGDGVRGGREEPLLPGSGQNAAAEEDHPLLRIVLVPNQTLTFDLPSCGPPSRCACVLTASLYLQVRRRLPVLRDQLQHLRFRRQHLPHTVHLRRHRSSRQNPDLLHPELDRPAEQPGVVSDDDGGSDWNKHGHTFR